MDRGSGGDGSLLCAANSDGGKHVFYANAQPTDRRPNADKNDESYALGVWANYVVVSCWPSALLAGK